MRCSGANRETQKTIPAAAIDAAIVDRTKRMVGLGGVFGVLFAPWSAARDSSADAAIVAAADTAMADEQARVVVASYVPEDAPAFAGDLANIRAGMIEGELVARGVDKALIQRDRGAAIGDQATKADLIEIRIDKE